MTKIKINRTSVCISKTGISAMATIGSIELIITAIVCFLFLLGFSRRKGLPIDWPIIGMLPICFPIFGHIFDKMSDVLELTKGTFIFKGPWFIIDRNTLITTDPTNLYHIMSTNFSNYPKGHDAKLHFEAYGEFLFTKDDDEWRNHRKVAHKFFSDKQIQSLSPKVNLEIIEKGLIPILDNASQKGIILDFQDLFKRFMIDSTCIIATGYNHGSLGTGYSPILKAMHDINEGILVRHILPQTFWKLQNWLHVGKERKLLEGWKTLDSFARKYVEKIKKDQFHAINFFPHDIMKDVIKILFLGGTDTLSSSLTYFFWHVFENPTVETIIREEIEANLSKKTENYIFVQPEELNKLVYLHAALLESMRLYPPAPFQARKSIKPDILPSGHSVSSNMKVVVCSYAMGRMKFIWGEDCLEFKPDRWISEKGRILPVPSHKFATFSSGPRICPGKDMALNRLKAVAATIIHNYDIKIIKNHPVVPTAAIILEMKYGLNVRISKRSI